MVTLKDFLDRVRDLPDDTPLCVAEVDEAFAAHVAALDVVTEARTGRSDADPTEAIELGGGNDRVVVIRW